MDNFYSTLDLIIVTRSITSFLRGFETHCSTFGYAVIGFTTLCLGVHYTVLRSSDPTLSSQCGNTCCPNVATLVVPMWQHLLSQCGNTCCPNVATLVVPMWQHLLFQCGNTCCPNVATLVVPMWQHLLSQCGNTCCSNVATLVVPMWQHLLSQCGNTCCD